MEDKNVLIISYAYPPNGTVGSRRIAKFAKYLPKSGWSPIVVTPREGYAKVYGLEDHIHLKGVSVIRTPDIDLVKALLKRRNVGESQGSKGVKYFGTFLNPFKALYTGLMIPDRDAPWIPIGLTYSQRIIATEKTRIKAIFSSSPSISNHCIAFVLKRRYNLPWIADLRDLWTLSPYRDVNKIREQIDEFVEKRLIASADRIIFISNELKEEFANKYPAVRESKFIVITNGFDPEDFEELSSAVVREKFTISYAGMFYEAKRDPTFFFKALREMMDSGVMDPKELRVNILGHREEFVWNLVERFGLQANVVLWGYVKYKDVLKTLKASSLLLLITHKLGKEITTKLFDYMGAKRPILAITPKHSELAKIITDGRLGHVVNPDNIEEIKMVLASVYKRWKEDSFRFNPDLEMIQRFDRRILTARLAKLLDEVTFR